MPKVWVQTHGHHWSTPCPGQAAQFAGSEHLQHHWPHQQEKKPHLLQFFLFHTLGVLQAELRPEHSPNHWRAQTWQPYLFIPPNAQQ